MKGHLTVILQMIHQSGVCDKVHSVYVVQVI